MTQALRDCLLQGGMMLRLGVGKKTRDRRPNPKNPRPNPTKPIYRFSVPCSVSNLQIPMLVRFSSVSSLQKPNNPIYPKYPLRPYFIIICSFFFSRISLSRRFQSLSLPLGHMLAKCCCIIAQAQRKPKQASTGAWRPIAIGRRTS